MVYCCICGDGPYTSPAQVGCANPDCPEPGHRFAKCCRKDPDKKDSSYRNFTAPGASQSTTMGHNVKFGMAVGVDFVVRGTQLHDGSKPLSFPLNTDEVVSSVPMIATLGGLPYDTPSAGADGYGTLVDGDIVWTCHSCGSFVGSTDLYLRCCTCEHSRCGECQTEPTK
jgi:hypothetical protein